MSLARQDEKDRGGPAASLVRTEMLRKDGLGVGVISRYESRPRDRLAPVGAGDVGHTLESRMCLGGG